LFIGIRGSEKGRYGLMVSCNTASHWTTNQRKHASSRNLAQGTDRHTSNQRPVGPWQTAVETAKVKRRLAGTIPTRRHQRRRSPGQICEKVESITRFFLVWKISRWWKGYSTAHSLPREERKGVSSDKRHRQTRAGNAAASAGFS
jgi:hypothetical protein